jgi:hypothetical protein
MYENIIGLLSAFFVFGLFVDGWAHNHGLVDESFFTPYHAIMYGAFALLGLALVGMHLYNVSRGYAFAQAVPAGLQLSLVGVLLFGVGGGLDMLWHSAFGIEENVEALLSPSHLLLMMGYLMILMGLIQAAWRQTGNLTIWTLIAWAGVLSIVLFVLQYFYFIQDAEVLVGVRPRYTYEADVIGVARFLMPAAVCNGVILLMLRRWRLPIGAVTFTFSLTAILMAWMLVNADAATYPTFFLIATLPLIVTGLWADGLLWRLQATMERATVIRILSGFIPFALCLLFMLSIHLLSVYRV